jgi:hypothetical protein
MTTYTQRRYVRRAERLEDRLIALRRKAELELRACPEWQPMRRALLRRWYAQQSERLALVICCRQLATGEHHGS